MNARVVGSISLFEVRHYLRDKISLFTTIVLPLVLVIVIGGSLRQQPPSFPIGVLDHDGSQASTEFVTALGEAALTTTVYTDEAELARDIRLGLMTGGVVIEPGFQEALAAPTGQAEITLSLEATSTNGPVVASAITSAASAFALEPTAVRVTTAALGGVDEQAVADIAAGTVATLPPISTEAITVGDTATDDGFARAVTTQFVLFTFLNGMLAAMTLVESRRLGVARRMLSTPTGIGPHILGVGLGRWWLGLLQAVILFGVGILLFGANFGSPLTTAVLTVLWAALAAAVGMLLGAVAKTPDQVVAISVPLGLGLAMLGGSMWPLSAVPQFMQTIGYLTPHAWANDAFLKAAIEGNGLPDVAREIAVLAGATVAFAALAVVLLRRSLSR